LDFNESVDVPGVGPATFAQARDSVGRATVMQRVHPAWQANQRIVKLTTEQVQADCRIAFAQWGLPDAIQTDRASLFVDDDATPFPTRLSLWWIGLGLTHQLIPRHTPECNGSVERSHRTTNERTLSGQAFRNAVHLQAQLDADWLELNARRGLPGVMENHRCSPIPTCSAPAGFTSPKRNSACLICNGLMPI
jgi:hypothetical protein